MSTENLKTTGIGTFGGDADQGLFSTVPGHSADIAMVHCAQLLASIHKLTLLAATGQDGDMVWAAHYLSGMAKALNDDMAHAMMMQDT